MRTSTGLQEPDPPGVAADNGTDLQQFESDRIGLRPGIISPSQSDLTQTLQQTVSK